MRASSVTLQPQHHQQSQGEVRSIRRENGNMWRIWRKGSFTSHTRAVSQKIISLINSVNVHELLLRVQWS